VGGIVAILLIIHYFASLNVFKQIMEQRLYLWNKGNLSIISLLILHKM